MQQSLEFYKKLSDDNRERLEATLEEVKELRSRNDSLEKELKEVRNQMFDIMANICMDLTCARRVTELSTKKASKKSSTTKS
jgi:cell division septum initiation protein DivIVA